MTETVTPLEAVSADAVSTSDAGVQAVVEGALPAPVAEEAMQAEQHAAADAHAEGGLPQMDVSSFSTQLFWLAVCFIALYLLMSRSVLPRVHEVLEKRRHRVAHDLDQADVMSRDAADAKADYEKLHAVTIEKSAAMVAEAQKLIKDTAEESDAKLEAELAAKLEEAEKSIASAVDKVKSDLAPVVSDIAGELVKAISGETADSKPIAAAVAKAEW